MKLAAIAQAIGCSLPGEKGTVEISRIASPEDADETCITFVTGSKYREQAASTRAGAVIVKTGCSIPSKTCLEVPDPYCGFAKAAHLFEDKTPLFDGPIHRTAIIDPGATVHSRVFIGPYSVIGKGCVIDEGTVIGALCVIENKTRVGMDCRIDSGAVIRRECMLGDRVIIQSGAIIGGEGFGNAKEGDKWVRIPSFGNVIIEDDAEIGANTTIDRGALSPTIIGRGVKIDNLVMIAHNVIVGENTAMAAQAGLAGSTKIGKRVLIAGQAGFVGHMEIGDDCLVGAQAGVTKSFGARAKITGSPARDLMHMRRIESAQTRLPELLREVKRLRKEVAELKSARAT